VTRFLAYGFTFGTIILLFVHPFTKLDLFVTMLGASFACWFWRRIFDA
jgi:hypothetical protein